MEVLLDLPAKKVAFDRLIPEKETCWKRLISVSKSFDLFKDDYYTFLGEHAWWLNDYALFQALKDEQPEAAWNEWEDGYKKRDSHVLDVAHHEYSEVINYHRFVQFIFFKQWFELKSYANAGEFSFLEICLCMSL